MTRFPVQALSPLDRTKEDRGYQDPRLGGAASGFSEAFPGWWGVDKTDIQEKGCPGPEQTHPQHSLSRQ